jgi:hypothetical protein
MRACILCGARVRNQNPKTNTCDPICTRAKHAGRDRQGQIEYELANGSPDDDQHFMDLDGQDYFV